MSQVESIQSHLKAEEKRRDFIWASVVCLAWMLGAVTYLALEDKGVVEYSEAIRWVNSIGLFIAGLNELSEVNWDSLGFEFPREAS